MELNFGFGSSGSGNEPWHCAVATSPGKLQTSLTENVSGFEVSILGAVTKDGLVENCRLRVANKNREIAAR